MSDDAFLSRERRRGWDDFSRGRRPPWREEALLTTLAGASQQQPPRSRRATAFASGGAPHLTERVLGRGPVVLPPHHQQAKVVARRDVARRDAEARAVFGLARGLVLERRLRDQTEVVVQLGLSQQQQREARATPTDAIG